MKWHPFFNAAGAAVYIAGIASFMRYISSIRHDTPDTFIDSVGFLSLFVLSAAVKGFLFIYRPAILIVDGQKGEGVAYFLKTVGIFAVITVLALAFVSLQ